MAFSKGGHTILKQYIYQGVVLLLRARRS